MIRFFTTAILILFLASEGHSQTDTLSKKFLNEELVLDINKYNWNNSPASIKENSTEISTTAYLFISGKEKNFSIAMGANVTALNIYSQFYVESDSSGNIVLTEIPDSINYSKNKIGVGYIGIPIEIRLKTNNNIRKKNFKFTLGAEIGYVLSSYHKYKGDNYSKCTANDKIKFKVYDIYGINKTVGTFYFKVFYDKFGLNFRYYVTPFFTPGSNLQLVSSYSFGLSIIIF
jgi:hypothetical protein